ncbi:MAG: hypothetical protein ACP5N2_00400 [Candidatus Nanoarchaeia archaeon]
MTLDELKKQSEELTDKIKVEIQQKQEAIAAFEKSIALQSDTLLQTDYFTNVRPELIKKVHNLGYSVAESEKRVHETLSNEILLQIGLKEKAHAEKSSTLFKSAVGLEVSLNMSYSNSVALASDVGLSGLLSKFYSTFDDFAYEFLTPEIPRFGSSEGLFMDVKIEAKGANSKYVALVDKDKTDLIIEYVAGFIHYKLEQVQQGKAKIAEKELDVFFNLKETTLFHSERFRSYIERVTDEAQKGDKSSLKVLGLISPYLKK